MSDPYDQMRGVEMTDELADLDSEFGDLPCVVEGCGDPATWILWRRRCCPGAPRNYLVCLGHLQGATTDPTPTACTLCASRWNPGRTAFLHFEPVNPPKGQ